MKIGTAHSLTILVFTTGLITNTGIAFAETGFGEGQIQTFSNEITVPSACMNITGHIQGWIKVFIPRRLDFGNTLRVVRHSVNPIGDGNSEGSTNANSDKDGTQADPKAGGKHDGVNDPFHIYLKSETFSISDTRNYVAVHLIIRKKSDLSFAYFPDLKYATSKGAYGVAAPKQADGSPDPSICTMTNADGQPQPGDRQVRNFYIDVSKVPPTTPTADPGISYNILLRPDDAIETPIVIDPKVYNDG